MAQIILDSANNLIQGDFDTATLSLRTRMQTSTTNATTGVYVVPNGSATSASVQVSNAADPTNASKVVVATNGSTDTQIVSGANGSGTYLPLSFYTNNDIRFQMGTAGELNVRTAPGTVSAGTSGQFLTSGGPGAGVSWTSAAGGSIQSQVFAAPGTWTKPSTVTQVRVTVIGGGGSSGTGTNGGLPGNAGGTSSFGPLVSATGGGAGQSGTTAPGTPGTGTVTAPATALRTSYIGLNVFTPATPNIISINSIVGQLSPTGTVSATTWSTSSDFMAGIGGSAPTSTYSRGGSGGYAIAIVPVSAPVSVTVGAGASASPAVPSGGSVSGAVLVEWVG